VVRLVSWLVLTAGLLPIPIGMGPRYHPPPGVHGVCVRASLHAGARVHLELFARRRVIIVPAAIGLRDARFRFGRAVAARCRARLWTSDPTGVVRFDGPAGLSEVFRVCGEPLARTRLLSFRGRVRLYRNGVAVPADPRKLRLRNHDELVLQVGGYVPPHRSYRFPP
jgi:hypothetical protein